MAEKITAKTDPTPKKTHGIKNRIPQKGALPVSSRAAGWVKFLQRKGTLSPEQVEPEVFSSPTMEN